MISASAREWRGGIATTWRRCGCTVSMGMSGGPLLSAVLCSQHLIKAKAQELPIRTAEEILEAVRKLEVFKS